MGLTQADPRLWAGVAIGAGALVAGVLVQRRYHAQEPWLAMSMQVMGVVWMVYFLLRFAGQGPGLHQIVSPLKFVGRLIGFASTAAVLLAAASLTRRGRGR